MPGLDPATYRLLAETAEELSAGGTVRVPALVPRFRGKKGHPLLLSRELRERISSAPPTATLREILAEVPNLLVPVEDSGVLQDVDTPEDYQGLSHTRS
jgi:molybdenum cofactor cytidylyltransferase